MNYDGGGWPRKRPLMRQLTRGELSLGTWKYFWSEKVSRKENSANGRAGGRPLPFKGNGQTVFVRVWAGLLAPLCPPSLPSSPFSFEN